MELLLTAIISFAATNIDDIVILVLFFAETGHAFRPRHVVLGQYLGVIVLILVSLVGFLGSFVLPTEWLGLLGLAPIGIGLHRLINRHTQNNETKISAPTAAPPSSAISSSLLNPRVYAVMIVTIANGGDNIGI